MMRVMPNAMAAASALWVMLAADGRRQDTMWTPATRFVAGMVMAGSHSHGRYEA